MRYSIRLLSLFSCLIFVFGCAAEKKSDEVQEEEFNKKLALLENAVEQDPDRAEYYRDLALHFLSSPNKDIRHAEAGHQISVEYYRKSGENTESIVLQAFALIQCDRLESAAAVSDHIPEGEYELEKQFFVAMIQNRLGYSAKAKASYEKALSMKPNEKPTALQVAIQSSAKTEISMN